jgi:hypothetical protein
MTCPHENLGMGPEPRWRRCLDCGETLRPLLVTIEEEVLVMKSRAGESPTMPPPSQIPPHMKPAEFQANIVRGRR